MLTQALIKITTALVIMVLLMMSIILAPITAMASNGDIPVQSKQYFPVIQSETKELLPDFIYPYYFAGLIELESCVTLTSKKCWSPTSELKSKREVGIGMGQITKTFKADGSIRFDSLSDMAKAHHNELKEASWNNIASRPDLQIKIVILMTKDNYSALYAVTDPYQRLAMADSAYNGGLGGLKKERRLCGLTANCDPQVWFSNVEDKCLKSKKPLYGKRSACDINRQHVTSVLDVKMVKYKMYF